MWTKSAHWAESCHQSLVEVWSQHLFHRNCGKLVSMALGYSMVGGQNICKVCPMLLVLFFISFTPIFLNAQPYVKFDNKPVEDWGFILERADVKQFYRVQRGDTLYDISKTLFGDPKFWSKIWSMNSNVTNPHIIEKGDIIYFTGGTIVLPPVFGIDSIDSQNYIYGSGLLEPLIPPKPLKNTEPISKRVFQNYFQPARLSKDEHNDLRLIGIKKRQVQFAKREIMVTSEVVFKKPLSMGKIKRIQGGRGVKKGALVLVSLHGKYLDTGPLQKTFTIFKYTKEGLRLKNTEIYVSLVEWLGTLKVLSHKQGGEYLAEIIEANDLITIGDSLSSEKIKTLTLPNEIEKIVSKASNSMVKIIGSNKFYGQNVIKEAEIVYFNGGSKKGILQGEVYPIFRNFGVDFLKMAKVRYFPESVGYVKIATVNKYYSTGVVFNLSDEVSTGSRLGVVQY